MIFFKPIPVKANKQIKGEIMTDVIIVGGGAAGLICGIEAARRGKQCIILEQKEKAGKKLYATGNGKCNFANRKIDFDRYHCVESDAEKWISHIISEETCNSVEAFFQQIGIPSVERQGYLYPRSEQAAVLVHALEQVFMQYHGMIHCDERVERINWKQNDNCVQVFTNNGRYRGRAIVLATGGMAASKLGSDGSGYELAKQLGHRITPCIPALCGLKCKEKGWNRLQGVRARGQVQLWQNDTLLGEEAGEIQFTQYGISGIVVFNLSRYAGIGLQKRGNITAKLDVLPEFTRSELEKMLVKLQGSCGYRSVLDVISGFLPDKLAAFVLERNGLDGKGAFSKCRLPQLQAIIETCKQLTIRIVDTNPFEQAQVTAGGVSLHEVDMNTMESRIQPGCYLVGELLDVDGACGGYNLMWAWETGRRAGRNL